jgi:hypothetical protein
VQHWVRTFGTDTFKSVETWGNTAADDIKDDPNEAGDQSRTTHCEAGKFGAPYAAALDIANNLYVMNTNCIDGNNTQVQRRDAVTGQWSIIVVPRHSNAWPEGHELAIDARGSLYMASINSMMRADTATTPPTTPVIPPAPVVDAAAPQLTTVTLPATTITRAVTATLAATDNVKVTQVRYLEGAADITTAGWVDYTGSITKELSDGNGAKTLRVQVRDAAGNVSAVISATTTYTAPVVVTPPVVTPPVVVPPVVVPPVVVPPVKVNQAPVVTDVILPDPATTQTVTVTTVATDDGTIAKMRLATEEGNWSAWRDWSPTTQFTLTAGEGFRGVSVQVQDAEGLLSNSKYKMTTLTPAVVTPPVVVPPADTVAPVITNVTYPETTTSGDVPYTLTATDNLGVVEMRTGNDSNEIIDNPWVAYKAANTFHFDVDGLAAVTTFKLQVQVRDKAGNIATTNFRTMYTPPVVTPPVVVPPVVVPPVVVPPVVTPTPVNAAPVLAKDGVTVPATTTSSTISVHVVATDDTQVTKVRFATEDGFWKAWQDYHVDSSFTLAAGVGAHGVFAQVADGQGLVSDARYVTLVVVGPPVPVTPVPPVVNPNPGQAPIVVDRTAPVLGKLNLPAVTASRNITISLTATDNVGVAWVRLANEDGKWGAWTRYTPTVAWSLTPIAMSKAVFVQVKDAAGNESNREWTTLLCSPCLPLQKVLASMKTAPAVITPRARRGSVRADRIAASALAQNFDLSQADHKRDVIDCGKGFDTALVQAEDVTRNCERVVVVHEPKG